MPRCPVGVDHTVVREHLFHANARRHDLFIGSLDGRHVVVTSLAGRHPMIEATSPSDATHRLREKSLWERLSRRARAGAAPFRIEISWKTMLLVVGTVAGCWIAVKLVSVVLVVVAALFMVGTLNPIVEWLERRSVKRGWGIAIVFLTLLLAMSALAAITLPSLFDEVRDAATHEPEIRGHLADLLARTKLTEPLSVALRDLHYEGLAKEGAQAALAISARAIESITYVISAVFLALYIMIDRDRLRGGLFSLVPRSHHLRLTRVLLNMQTIVGGYIRGQLSTSGLIAAFAFGLLLVCRVPNALALAVFAGIADVLPYVGVFFVIVPMAIAAASKGVVLMTIVIVAMIAYEEVESRFLIPRIYGRALRLPSSVVLVSLLVGGTLLGLVGAFLALPAAAGVRMLVDELRVKLPGEAIDDTELRERDERAEKEYAERVDGVPAEQAAAVAVEISKERQEEEGGPEHAASVPITSGHAH